MKTAREILINKLDGFIANKFKEGVVTNIIQDRQFLQAVIDEFSEIAMTTENINGKDYMNFKIKVKQQKETK